MGVGAGFGGRCRERRLDYDSYNSSSFHQNAELVISLARCNGYRMRHENRP